MNHSEKFNLLIQQLREITAKLLQTSIHGERVPLLKESRFILKKLDELMHEDGEDKAPSDRTVFRT